LRREEVAALAHMSTDFHTRLEQHRGWRPSEQTLAALARALRLTPDERDHVSSSPGTSRRRAPTAATSQAGDSRRRPIDTAHDP